MRGTAVKPQSFKNDRKASLLAALERSERQHARKYQAKQFSPFPPKKSLPKST